MAVTIATYTNAGVNYTPTQLATALGSAFIDSGIMIDWYASFTSGSNQVRVLEVIYDPTKAYGKTYYIFIFSGADIFVTISSGWNTSSNIPAGPTGAGTQYLDWFSTTISTTNALRLTASTTAGFNNAQSATVRRYTSTVRSNFSVILIANGTTTISFFIERTAPNPSMVDLSKEFYTSMFWPRVSRFAATAQVGFQLFPMRTRRTQLGSSLRSVTDGGQFGNYNLAVSPWEIGTDDVFFLMGCECGFIGNDSNFDNNDRFTRRVDLCPNRFSNTNPEYPANVVTPYFNVPFNCYSSAVLPGDFAAGALYNSNTTQTNATVQITPGVEEYEVVAVANADTLGRPTAFFGARTVGSP